ncbi:hypothetical protein BCV70DRAFT_26027 [Testicularia cyperi]|uniref:Uncharacterized protein n=1 Tax=Testicularia cyperi TaxID=1882483 RepID=A0A317XLH8_9BASI|nr:hypothetical protein BCV70DRAFT_26027 [Testicularia cyperi]
MRQIESTTNSRSGLVSTEQLLALLTRGSGIFTPAGLALFSLFLFLCIETRNATQRNAARRNVTSQDVVDLGS